jgi:hypothetical protein
LIIYTVEAEKHHDNWNLNTETVINETETSDMLSVSDTEESTNLFNDEFCLRYWADAWTHNILTESTWFTVYLIIYLSEDISEDHKL